MHPSAACLAMPPSAQPMHACMDAMACHTGILQDSVLEPCMHACMEQKALWMLLGMRH